MNFNMKVLHIISAPAAGGAEVYVKDLVLNSHNHGLVAEILFISRAKEVGRCVSYEKNFLEDLDKMNVKYYFLKEGARRNLLKGYSNYKFIIKKSNPDIVHSHLLTGNVYHTASLSKKKLVYTHHNIKVGTNKFIFNVLTARSQSIIGISEKCSSVLCGILLKSSRVVTIFNAVDIKRLSIKKEITSLPKTQRKILAVGSLTEQKNYELMINVFSSLKRLVNDDLHLYIAGEGSKVYTDKIINLIQKLDLNNNVTLLGNRNDVPEIMRECDLFLMTSKWEGLPIALIEAQVLGLPSLVTNVGGCSEVIELTGGGTIVDLGDSESITLELSRYFNDSIYYQKVKDNLADYGSTLDISCSLKKHVSEYSKCLGR
ncbi:conserved hypothetical protein [Vibrio chagasii]|nr:conserved hypothetical protein [Vibrio chagasii]CAH7484457.1 conserved hypothetical protein [Vibrio chagasii]